MIRAFNNDDHERARFAETNATYTALSKRLFKLMSVTQPIFFFLMNLAALAIFWVAATLISSSQMQVGQLVAFMDYLFHAMFSFMLFCLVFMMYPRAPGQFQAGSPPCWKARGGSRKRKMASYPRARWVPSRLST